MSTSLPELDVSKRVYLLSLLLQKEQYKLRTKDVHEETAIVVRNTGLGSFAKVLNHIVILLSRGTVAEADLTVAASAGPLRADGGHVLITYHSPNSPPSSRDITTSSSIQANVSLSEAQTTGEPRPKIAPQDSLVGNWQKSPPTPKSRTFTLDREIAEERIREILPKTPNDVAFPEYAEFAFSVARALAQKKISLLDASIFFMRHCHLKVDKRLSRVEKMYIESQALWDWKPDPLERVAEEFITLPGNLTGFFATLGLAADGDRYRFHSSNAHLWLRSVIFVIQIFRKEMDAITRDADFDLVKVCEASATLHQLLKVLPRSLWRIISLTRLLDGLRANGLSRGFSIFSLDHDTDGEPSEEDELVDMSFLDDSDVVPSKSIPNASLLFIRSLDATTAWTTAARFLSKQRFLKSPVPIFCSLVDLPNEKPTNIDWSECKTPSDRWFSSGPLSQGKRKDDQEQALKAVVQRGNDEKSGYPGACHCETGIMASMIGLVVEGGSFNPMTDEIKAAFLPFVEEYRTETTGEQDRFMDIGVATKSCAICYLTHNIVNDWLKDKGHRLQFRLPGAHSVYYPWMPPTWLPVEVLNVLENAMLERLAEMVTEGDRLGESQTSSPNDTDNEDDGILILSDTSYLNVSLQTFQEIRASASHVAPQ